MRVSADHLLLVASLEERYATCGKIGLARVEKIRQTWNLRLLLICCRAG